MKALMLFSLVCCNLIATTAFGARDCDVGDRLDQERDVRNAVSDLIVARGADAAEAARAVKAALTETRLAALYSRRAITEDRYLQAKRDSAIAQLAARKAHAELLRDEADHERLLADDPCADLDASRLTAIHARIAVYENDLLKIAAERAKVEEDYERGYVSRLSALVAADAVDASVLVEEEHELAARVDERRAAEAAVR